MTNEEFAKIRSELNSLGLYDSMRRAKALGAERVMDRLNGPQSDWRTQRVYDALFGKKHFYTYCRKV